MAEQKELTPISALGEFGLIERITKEARCQNLSTKLGVGDDAAILDFSDHETLISSDMLVEGVHFDLSYMPLKHLGYKSVVVSISDIVAMNGTPSQIIVSIGASARTSVEALDELYSGINDACKHYQVDLVGGDTVSSRSGLVISMMAIGYVEKGKSVKRSGAKANDLICVTGDLGAAYMGLQILIREKEVFKVNPNSQPDLSTYEYIIQRQLKPETPVNMLKIFENIGVPTSMIDISDGLSSELIHLCKASKTGCVIYEEQLPIDHTTVDFGMEIQIDGTIAAMNGGEDYELLFTMPLDMYDTIKRYPEIRVIGHMTDEQKGCQLIGKDGTLVQIEAQGYSHS
ncbi:MAG: thiamine-phosphate kinase [Bacteroidales bacterium]|nr:thiamine-phosphate kinase [Bacteroidales bacterium]